MQKTQGQKIRDFLINNGVIIVMIVLVIYTGFTSKNFFTVNNFLNLIVLNTFHSLKHILHGFAGV